MENALSSTSKGPDVPAFSSNKPGKKYGLMVGMILAVTALVAGCTAPPASPLATPETSDTMTVTFVRHGESASNAAGIADTTLPGPLLTAVGEEQAADVAAELEDEDFDAVYASTMIRAQQTAAPLAQALREDVRILPGVQEVDYGDLNGQPNSAIAGTVSAVIVDGWLKGDPEPSLPGGDSGTVLKERLMAALASVYDKGLRDVAIFSHGCTIACGLSLLATNADQIPADELQIGNGAVIVVEGTPLEGWTIREWNGTRL